MQFIKYFTLKIHVLTEGLRRRQGDPDGAAIQCLLLHYVNKILKKSEMLAKRVRLIHTTKSLKRCV
jgi:hypothetical protein